MATPVEPLGPSGGWVDYNEMIEATAAGVQAAQNAVGGGMPEWVQLVAVICGAVASVATCAFIIFMFKRAFTTQDKLSTAVERLSSALTDFKMCVKGEYVTVTDCKDCKADREHWREKFETEVNERLREGDKKIVRLETLMEKP